MAQDAQKLDQSLFAVHYIWLGPLSLAAICVYLYYTLDSLTFLAGVCVICVLVLPVQAAMTKVFSVLRLAYILYLCAAVSTNSHNAVYGKLISSSFANFRTLAVFIPVVVNCYFYF